MVREEKQIPTAKTAVGMTNFIVWVPKGMIMFLDSSRIEVLPLAGRSFHYKPLASNGDRDAGQVIGEYTLELRNENAHGIISGFTA